MPSLARNKPRAPRPKSVCICGHVESDHREPLDAYTGIAVGTKKMCRARVAVLQITGGRQCISVTSPCPCAAGFALARDFAEV